MSVITVCFNSALTIKRTIESVAAQTYPAIEYIVIDGASTDGTVDILKQHDDTISTWISETDRGISDAFNKGIALSTGYYISIVNSDDWLEPHHLEIAVGELAATGISYVFGDLVLHAPSGEIAHLFVGEPNYRARIRHYMPFINHPTVVCRRSAFEKHGLFDPSLRTAMDYDWFLRLDHAGCVGKYNPKLVSHMSLEGQSDSNFRSALREVRDISIRHGYPGWLAKTRYLYRLAKGVLRRQLESRLPAGFTEGLRNAVNANYRRVNDQTK